MSTETDRTKKRECEGQRQKRKSSIYKDRKKMVKETEKKTDTEALPERKKQSEARAQTRNEHCGLKLNENAAFIP